LPAFERACHLVPDVQVFVDQPVDQVAHFAVNLFRHIRLDLCLEFGFDLVWFGKVENAGQFHGVVQVVLPAIFKTVEDILHFSQAGRQLGCQLATIGFQHAFEVCRKGDIFADLVCLSVVAGFRFCHQVSADSQRITQL